ncbi:MBL fold metallo-hydrolase [Paenibacillus sp. WLX1005]|uniref:MBL fold metallo-hydrolase n=1 Tax=unclassified Paenibacillus TaxID=185978 RepID=UPI0039845545
MVKRLVRLADHVYRLALPYGEGTVNSYLFEGKNGYTVMDTGVQDEATRREWKQLRDNGLVIEKVIITHTHPDHIGLAPWFQQEWNVPVICSRNSYELMSTYHRLLEQKQPDDHTPYAFNRKYDGPEIEERQFYRYMGSVWLEPDELYKNHDIVMLGDEPYEAIWTPGHAADHFCFWHAPSKLLIAGDLMFADTAPVIPFWSEEDVNPLEDYFHSLDLIETYPAELVLPGHDHVIHDLHQRIRDIRNAHHFRMQQILGSLTEGRRTAGQLCREIYGTGRPASQELLEFYTALARLVYLRNEGFVESVTEGDKVYFQRK